MLLLHAAAILWRRRGEKDLPVPELARSRVFSASVLFLFLLDALAPFRLLLGERVLPWQGVNGLVILLLAWWGRLLCGGAAESAGVSPQAAADVDRIRLRVFLQFLLGVTVASSLLMTGRLHVPVPFMMISGPVYRGEGIFMLALFSVSVLLAGSAWCSHLCYFGVWDCLSAASSRRKGRPVKGGKGLRDWRWAALAARVGTPRLPVRGDSRWNTPWRLRLPRLSLAPGLENERRGRREGILQQVLPHGAGRRFAGQAVPLAHAREGDVHRVHAVRRRLP